MEEVILQERKRWTLFGVPWTFTKYTVTSKKLITEEGILTTRENEILLYRITDISYVRTLCQKMFGLGTLVMYSYDKTNPTLEIKNIKNSRHFKETLSDLVEKDRQRIRLRQTEVMEPDSIDYMDSYYKE